MLSDGIRSSCEGHFATQPLPTGLTPGKRTRNSVIVIGHPRSPRSCRGRPNNRASLSEVCPAILRQMVLRDVWQNSHTVSGTVAPRRRSVRGRPSSVVRRDSPRVEVCFEVLDTVTDETANADVARSSALGSPVLKRAGSSNKQPRRFRCTQACVRSRIADVRMVSQWKTPEDRMNPRGHHGRIPEDGNCLLIGIGAFFD